MADKCNQYEKRPPLEQKPRFAMENVENKEKKPLDGSFWGI